MFVVLVVVVCRLVSAVWCVLSVVGCGYGRLLSAVDYCSLSGVCWLVSFVVVVGWSLFAVRCLVYVGWCLLSGVSWLLAVVCVLLSVGVRWCLLFVGVWCMLVVA